MKRFLIIVSLIVLLFGCVSQSNVNIQIIGNKDKNIKYDKQVDKVVIKIADAFKNKVVNKEYMKNETVYYFETDGKSFFIMSFEPEKS